MAKPGNTFQANVWFAFLLPTDGLAFFFCTCFALMRAPRFCVVSAEDAMGGSGREMANPSAARSLNRPVCVIRRLHPAGKDVKAPVKVVVSAVGGYEVKNMHCRFGW